MRNASKSKVPSESLPSSSSSSLIPESGNSKDSNVNSLSSESNTIALTIVHSHDSFPPKSDSHSSKDSSSSLSPLQTTKWSPPTATVIGTAVGMLVIGSSLRVGHFDSHDRNYHCSFSLGGYLILIGTVSVSIATFSPMSRQFLFLVQSTRFFDAKAASVARLSSFYDFVSLFLFYIQIMGLLLGALIIYPRLFFWQSKDKFREHYCDYGPVMFTSTYIGLVWFFFFIFVSVLLLNLIYTNWGTENGHSFSESGSETDSKGISHDAATIGEATIGDDEARETKNEEKEKERKGKIEEKEEEEEEKNKRQSQRNDFDSRTPGFQIPQTENERERTKKRTTKVETLGKMTNKPIGVKKRIKNVSRRPKNVLEKKKNDVPL